VAEQPPGGASVYPVPEPATDRPLSIGVTVEVGDVLVRYGFPRPGGLDLVDLDEAIRWFVYGPRSTT